ncbi:hypothetical protein [Klebsiella aerogenes]|uniref:hypothetical protein n=1 Tax=Klebsiella aerogenes TaxID=548 RepID=UPI0007B37060|nr:hypothetical protein [Klebsiella aerogenes]KZQ48289.1 hypothetical protein A3N58_11850 [Klebsiella aerogenes]
MVMSSIAGVMGSLASGLAKGIASGSETPASASDVLENAGIKSSMQGVNPPPAGNAEQPIQTQGAAKPSLTQSLTDLASKSASDVLTGVATQGVNAATSHLVDNLFGDPLVRQAKSQGKAAKVYGETAYPGTNVWDKLGAAGASSGAAAAASAATNLQDKQFKQQKELTKMQLENQKDIAGIAATTSRLNTKDQVYSQNAQLTGIMEEREARIQKTYNEAYEIATRSDINREQKINIMHQRGLIDSQTQGQLLNNKNIPLTGDLIKQNTQNARYGSSMPGALSKDLINLGGDAYDGLIDSYQHWRHQNDVHSNSNGVNGSMSRK